ncbi:uroporphyrinogen-III C-methyltransferase [Larsenimonas sp. GH3-8]|nr:uroporphyrinogen-III C-methyltransferase [Larsenimonas rhizosphaerae]MCM2129429.1 uroporphyrinogen-III C-methyltransferase [Larsenimonas rhizosphaerae]
MPPARTALPAALSGQVALVGAGPGALDLLTIRALDRISAAEAVVYDRLVGPDILARIPPGCERYYVGKACGHHSVPQAEIGALLVRLAGEGKRVVRLKGGDPAVFGRMGEELSALAEVGIDAEIVPGITAASGAAAALGMPLTDRAHAQGLRFITAQQYRAGHGPDWQGLARRDETLVFYMGLGRVGEISQGLMQAGLPADWPMMLIAHASLPSQQVRVSTLRDMPDVLAHAPLPSPCLIVVGSVVSMQQAISMTTEKSLQTTLSG